VEIKVASEDIFLFGWFIELGFKQLIRDERRWGSVPRSVKILWKTLCLRREINVMGK
jgi:hypothetical protein